MSVTVPRGTLHRDVIDAGSADHRPRIRTEANADSGGRGLRPVREPASTRGRRETPAGRVARFRPAEGWAMTRWDYPPRCLGPHVSPARSHCEPLSWNVPQPGESQAVRWTCDCEPVVYELRQMGDLRFIRRTERAPGDPLVTETDRRPAAEADATWTALLSGLVR